MSVLPVGIGSSGGYEIGHSLRFRASNSAYLSRTPSSSGNARLWTWSGWVKRGTLGATVSLFGGNINGNNATELYFTGDTLGVACYIANVSKGRATTPAVLRDATAWYHVVCSMDTAQTSFANGWAKIWVNGVQQTLAQLDAPVQNTDTQVNVSGNPHWIGRDIIFGSAYFDGLLSEINFIDGQALTPSSFGETNADGVWVPKLYSGTYGTNGFYLPFNDGTSATTLGYDRSGNANNWTASGITTPDDQRKDSPTNNHACYNRLIQQVAGSSITNANNTFECTLTGSEAYELLTMPTGTTGKYYVEFQISSGTNVNTSACEVGLVSGPHSIGTNGRRLDECSSSTVYRADGQKGIDASFSSYGASWGANDKIGIAVNKDANEVTFYKNNTSQGTITSLDTQDVFIGVCLRVTSGTGSVLLVNDEALFAYTPPTGFKALCTANRGTGSITTSGTFTGNLNADGPFVWLNGNPSTMTINGNAVTWGTHADKTAGGFKVRSSSASYNASGSNTYSVSVTGELFGDVAHDPNTAQGNP